MCSLSGLHFPFILPLPFHALSSCALPPPPPPIPLCSNAIIGYSQSQALNARSTFLSQGLCTFCQTFMCPTPFFQSKFDQTLPSQEICSGPPCPRGPLSARKSSTFLAHFSSLHSALPEITSCLLTSGLPAPLAQQRRGGIPLGQHCVCLCMELCKAPRASVCTDLFLGQGLPLRKKQ